MRGAGSDEATADGTWTEERHGPVVLARWSRPPMNYFTDAGLAGLSAGLDRWEAEGIGALVLAGGVPGRFITHFDVDEVLNGQRAMDPVTAPRRSTVAQALTLRLHSLPFPVLAALNGDAMGWGFELALAADARVGERGDHRYGLVEVRLGIVPGAGGLTRMARLAGTGRALLHGLSARPISPEEAHGLGLVEELADDSVAAALAHAQRIAAMPRTAVAMAKRLVHRGADLPLRAALDQEADCAFRAKLRADSAAALTAYRQVPPADRRNWLEADPRRV
ncbi:enoyl-CoA hydratase/isomerase family protein [Amycolatopsis echigonensis]|uniref:Enoyl-CoA hydratase/isomerase family protein n=1 Tax=Amycolatopsis echigonensis TaxID=2576905 RepID=A0A8E2B6M0_9PSEU|nr:enoyl-CoA hydratase/isomerase family protein [Amycolatopsis echigonensis]MBB2502367.1 enoyl-CoA hydratase/isomerase family protein [Amycolatopsis echigonensis]